MAFDIGGTVAYVKRLLEATDLFNEVLIGRLTSPTGEGPSATIYAESLRVVELTLNTAIELHTLKVRIYRARYSEGDDTRELEALTLVGQVIDLLYGKLALDGSPRNIDIGGQYGTPIEIVWVDQDEAQGTYHIADLSLPLIADNATALAL